MQSELAWARRGWAGGLFEGEGSVTSCGGRRRLQLKMTTEESVRRFHRELGGLGTVYGPYNNNSAAKDGHPRNAFWMWVAELGDAEAAVELLFPLVSEWRRRAMVKLFPDVVGESTMPSRENGKAGEVVYPGRPGAPPFLNGWGNIDPKPVADWAA